MMATIKELFERRRSLEAQTDIYEEVLSLVYTMKGLKEKHGADAVDAVLMTIDTKCLTPLREELEQIDRLEVGDGSKKEDGGAALEKTKQPKRASKRKASRAKVG